MSGIVAIVRTDGAPIDSGLVDSMTRSMDLRGPAARHTWSQGNIGLGHTLLATTFEAESETQPHSVDGHVWITADARIDDRDRLKRELAGRVRANLATANDCELILHAYSAWGDTCVQHLLGDFAFAIWDDRQRRLFCARDHFGVKPLFYAKTQSGLVVGNTLNTIRLHPQVSERLNERAVGDFLLFSQNQDPHTTVFADIRRVPPAHTLTWTVDALSVSRYWTLQNGDFIRYQDPEDYSRHFLDVFDAAVEDRMRTTEVGVAMSGGMDSTAVAAAANSRAQSSGRGCSIRAFTTVTPFDDEQEYASLAAAHLKIPIKFHRVGAVEPYACWDDATLSWPEPVDSMEEVNLADSRHLNTGISVFLTGFGGDPLFRGRTDYYLWHLRRLQFGALAMDVRLALKAGRRPPVYARMLWRACQGRRRRLGRYPTWVNKEFEQALDLRRRWRSVLRDESLLHSTRSELSSPFWPFLFEGYDPSVTSVPAESRHPFFDRRVVDFMLRVPLVPWCLQKELLRVSMRDRLPQPILARKKTLLPVNPYERALAEQPGEWWAAKLGRRSGIDAFVDVDAVKLTIRKASQDVYRLRQAKQVLGLSLWLWRNVGGRIERGPG